jgi:hypothetical protein
MGQTPCTPDEKSLPVANPFLVFGGVAVGIAVAGFGILQVPGWISAAQDAAAINDIGAVRGAQDAASGETGSFANTLEDFASGDWGTGYTLSDGVKLVGMAGDSQEYCIVLLSAAGNHFAGSNRSADVGRGSTPEEAAAAADCAIEPVPAG